MQTMDFVYIEDIARANILAANSTVTDDACNIGSGTDKCLSILAHALLRQWAHPSSPSTVRRGK